MEGFANVFFPGLSTNSHLPGDVATNCYYCTVAALLNMTTAQLFQITEEMEHQTGTPDDICNLFKDAGALAQYRTCNDEGTAYAFLRGFSGSVGLCYTRPDASGHMVVATMDVGFYPFARYSGVKCVDYQPSPPAIRLFPPEAGLVQYLIFFPAPGDEFLWIGA